ncbi:MAG TPA: metallophosphoesterase [Verrucomicrobiae bacterium]|jgi:3',5'-cyclic AMP phosphodiesterase CpdA
MKRVKLIPSAVFVFLVCALSACVYPPAQEKGVVARIALVSDTHTTRGTNNDQPKYRARLDRVMAAANAAQVDLVLIAGDLTENGSPEETSDFQNQIKGFKAPVLFVPGNHDVGNKLIPGKGGTVSADRVAAFEKTLGPSFHAQTRAGLRVIGVNSPIFGSGFEREMAMWDFLEKELARPAPVPTVVFMHYPPFVKQADESGGDYWNIEPEPRARLLSLLRRGGVRTVFSGHLHRDLTNRHAGILFVTTRPVSFGLPAGKQPEGWTLVTLPAEGEAQVEPQTIGD